MTSYMYQPGHDISAKERTVDVLTKENVSFKDLLLSPHVLSGLQKSRFDRPSPIQLKAIPYGRCGLDLIVQAKSGTGKTCVFTVIALEAISVDAPTLQVIILAPTREIAIQIEDVMKAVGQDVKGLKIAAFIGGRPVYEDKVNAKGCHIAVGSPGRIFQLIELEILKCQNVRIFILDEADKLLEENFQSQINSIYSMLPANKQMIAASATYPNELADFVTRYMRDPTFVRLNPQDMALLGVDQYFHLIKDPPDKFHSAFECKIKAVVELLDHYPFQQALIFSNYHSHAKDLSDACNSVGLPATYISGNLEQERRLEAMKMLKDFKCKVLISTDLTSRGIDASNVDLVLNLDVPMDWETYMHRTGRAGRFGSHGAVVSVVSSGKEYDQLLDIAKVCGIKLYPLTCESGSIEYDATPVDFANSLQEVSVQQNYERNNPTLKKDFTNVTFPQNQSDTCEVSDQDSLLEHVFHADPSTATPKIPSLPELMSQSCGTDRFSYSYHELLENFHYFKEHCVFKELRRIEEVKITAKDSADSEFERTGKLQTVMYKDGGAVTKKKDCSGHLHKADRVVNGMLSTQSQVEENTQRLSRIRRTVSSKNGYDHQAAGDQIEHIAEGAVGGHHAASDGASMSHETSEIWSRSSKVPGGEAEQKDASCNKEYWHAYGESHLRRRGEDRHKTKTKPHQDEKFQEISDSQTEKQKPNRESKLPQHPNFLLPRFCEEFEAQRFARMGIRDYIRLQNQCQVAWQNFFQYYWWMQWYSMLNICRNLE